MVGSNREVRGRRLKGWPQPLGKDDCEEEACGEKAPAFFIAGGEVLNEASAFSAPAICSVRVMIHYKISSYVFIEPCIGM